MELKKLIIQDIPATLLDANTGFGGMQPSSTTWTDDYRGHQAKGKLRRDHSWFTSLEANPTMLPCSAAPCSEDIVGESWVSSVSAGQTALPFVIFVRLSDMFGARSHGPVDNKPAKPTQNFSWMTASALTTLLEPRVAPQMCFPQAIAKKTLGEHGSCQRSAGLLTACIGSRCFKNLLPNFWDCRVYRSLV